MFVGTGSLWALEVAVRFVAQHRLERLAPEQPTSIGFGVALGLHNSCVLALGLYGQW